MHDRNEDPAFSKCGITVLLERLGKMMCKVGVNGNGDICKVLTDAQCATSTSLGRNEERKVIAVSKESVIIKSCALNNKPGLRCCVAA